MAHFTDTLNPAQKDAVFSYQNPSLIVAGAGSGKTRVLTSRIAYMIEQGVNPGSILALTFTNKAAREMRQRIDTLITDGNSRYIWMGTFHSIFYRILRQEAQRLGFDNNFTIYDTSNSESLITAIVKERNLDSDDYRPKDILSRISLAKNNLVTADAYAANSTYVAEDRQRRRPEFAAVFMEYSRRCKANNAMDFDDLLLYTNILFRDFPEALRVYQERFRYILVDEYQDTNYAQYFIVRKLAEGHSNVCVVGDDAQSIYSFRGARIENILRFQNDFPQARLFKLEQNYRSTQNIVNAANSIIAKNGRQIPKNVFSENEEGDKIKVIKAFTDQEEAYIVASRIKFEGRENGGKWNEIAVLYRNNSQSRVIEDALRRQEVPYRIYSGRSFYDRKEIKDLVAYFRLIVNPRDNEALKRVINTPARGIGSVTVSRIAAAAQQAGISMWEVLEKVSAGEVASLGASTGKLNDFTSLIKSLSEKRNEMGLYDFGLEVATRSGIIGSYRLNPGPDSDNALENIGELLSSMQTFKEERIDAYQDGESDSAAEPTIDEWLQNISLMTDMDNDAEDSENRVVLMTVHSAKGLEFDTVFVVGVEENLFPSLMSTATPDKLEEERRLFYVAITRAKKRAFVSFAGQRFKWGNTEFCSPSRFISEMDERYVELPPDMDSETVVERPSGDYRQRSERSVNRGSGTEHSSSYGERGASYGGGNRSWSGGGAARGGVANGSADRPKPVITAAPVHDPANMRSLGSRRAAVSADAGEMSVAAGASGAAYAPGMRVGHAKFGYGKVIDVENITTDLKITVVFDDPAVGRKSLLARYAKLKILS